MTVEQIKIGDMVKANRFIPKKNVNKNEIGIVEFSIVIQSETYLDVRLGNNRMIETSSENCWDKVE